MLRLGILPEGYIYPKEERPVRDLLRKRSQLVRQRTMNILSIQNLVARNTGRGISGNELCKVGDGFWEEVFPCEENILAVKSNHFVIECINEQIRLIEQAVLKQARVKKEYQVLTSTRGIGKVLALTIMLETGNIRRFPKVGNYASYCRCVDSEKISNGKRKGSGNTKCGNKYLGWAYIEAANFVIRHNPIVKRYYQRKMAKTKRVIALKAVAHKLARAFYHMLRDQVPFQAERAFA
jgi:transposase